MGDKLNKLTFKNNCQKFEEELSKCSVTQINELENGCDLLQSFFLF